jgi:hypothetical protein
VALSAFDDRSQPPRAAELAAALGDALAAWNELQRRLAGHFVPLEREWGFTSKTTGWGMRLRHQKRIILYMTPCHGYFLASFAFGEKAVATALASGLPAPVVKIIHGAKKYAEGRGVRLEVRGLDDLWPLETLARAKMAT